MLEELAEAGSKLRAAKILESKVGESKTVTMNQIFDDIETLERNLANISKHIIKSGDSNEVRKYIAFYKSVIFLLDLS